MPGGLDVALDPLFNLGNVFFRVLKILAHVIGLAAAHETVLRRLAGLGVDGPAAMLNARGDVIGPTVGLGVLKIEILGTGGRIIGVEACSCLTLKYRYARRGRLTGACL